MRRCATGLLLALTLGSPTPAAQDLDRARALLEQALAALKPAPVAIATPAALDQALAAAKPGDVLTLSPTLVYPAALTLKQSITLQSTIPLSRMDRATPLPQFQSGLTIAGDDITLIGVQVTHMNPLTDLVVIRGARVTLDRVRVLGDPAKGAKRGIAANGNGTITIRRSYVADCFGPYPGQDTQAIGAWDMAPGLVVEDNYLEGGSETILLGGADPPSADRTPRDVTIARNTITKNPAWQTRAVGVKNTLEIKNAIHVDITENTIEYAWGGHGQDGYGLMLTTRNQDGRAPFSTIENVTITANAFAHMAAAINVLGSDNLHPSGRLTTVTIATNTWTDVDPVTYTGSNRLILVDRGPRALTIRANTFAGRNIGSVVYFAGGPPAEDLAVVDNTWPPSKYGIFGNASTVAKAGALIPPAWPQYVLSGTLSGNRVQ